MDWVKLSTTYDTDAAIMRAGESAEVLFTRALAYCGREETGGFVPDGMPARLCPKATTARVNALVRERLWIRDDRAGGWRFRSWESWNSELDALAQRRRADRERKQRERERRAQEARASRDASRDSHVTDFVTGRSRTASTLIETESSFSRDEPDTQNAGPAQTDFMSRDHPRDPRARDREERVESKNKTPNPRPYGTQGRTARADDAPPTDAEPSRVEVLIAEYRDASPRGIPSRQAERLAAEIHTLIRDGFDDTDIRNGLGQLRVRRLGPAMLPSLVDELANAPAAAAATPGTNVVPFSRTTTSARPSTTDQRVGQALALADRFAAEEQP